MNMAERKKISVRRTATYHTLGDIATVDTIWLVLHGYGQLSEYFIRNFTSIQKPGTYIIAPEALSRFYLQGFSGRVGASWMTKEAREDDIGDYIYYLDKIFEELATKVDLSAVKINLLGFSQGAPTLYRWVIHTRIKINKLIFWSGIFPPDMNTDGMPVTPEKLKDIFNRKEVYIIYGNSDQFLKEEHQGQLKQWSSLFPNLQILLFDGGHHIDEATLKTVSE